MKKATRQQTKLHNTRLVLKTLYQGHQLSRADIARLTHLTRPTVSSIVADLIDNQLVIEVGTGPSAGGKRPTLLNIADHAHQLLCLDLGSQAFRGALLNLRGNIIKRTTYPTDQRQGQDALDLVYTLIDDLLTQATAPVLGIGIGTPGLIDPYQGIVRQAVNLGWLNLPLRQQLAQRYQKPTYIANDSHIAALAEYTYAHTSNSNNLLLIKIGQGIATGILLTGQPYYGDGFGAGEIGHVRVAENGDQCTCGNRGCLETTTSTRAILQKATTLAQTHPNSALAAVPTPTWETIVTALQANDPHAKQLVAEAGHYLGISLANLIGTLNIHQVVVSGRVDQFGPHFLEAAQKEASQRALSAIVAETTLRYSSLGQDIVILGCSAMILKQELGII